MTVGKNEYLAAILQPDQAFGDSGKENTAFFKGRKHQTSLVQYEVPSKKEIKYTYKWEVILALDVCTWHQFAVTQCFYLAKQHTFNLVLAFYGKEKQRLCEVIGLIEERDTTKHKGTWPGLLSL